MKKKLFLALVIATLFVCIFALSASAVTQAEADKYYYDKVYVTADGQHELALYDKEGDTYYPLAWFAYDVLGEDGTTVVETKYVKVRFEDVTVYSEEYTQGRFNGVYYEYTDESGNTIVLNSSNAVLLNLRGGVMAKTMNSSGGRKATNITIKTFEWSKGGYPGFSKLEAVYMPLSATTVGAYPPSSIRVLDIDRHHASLTIGRGTFKGTKIKEIYIPAGSTFDGNDQFHGCSKLETIIFGTGIANINIQGYSFNGANSLKRIYWLGTKEELDTITVASTNNGPYFNLTHISFTEYMQLSEDVKAKGKYLVYETPECFALGHLTEAVNACVGQCTICNETVINHSKNAELTVNAVYADYAQEGKKVTTCTNAGCTYCVEEELEALIRCDGFSTEEEGTGIVVGYHVNETAIKTYTELTGKTVKYGLYAATKTALKDNEIIGEDGMPTDGAVKAEVNEGFIALELKICGITDTTAMFAMGAYLEISDGVTTEYEYIEDGEPAEGEKYCFVSYDSVSKK